MSQDFSMNWLPPSMANLNPSIGTEKPIGMEDFPFKKRTVVIYGEPQDFHAVKKMAVLALHFAYQVHDIRRRFQYVYAFDLGAEQYEEKGIGMMLKMSGSWWLDMLESVPPTNQKYVASVLNSLTSQMLPGVITTATPPSQWRSVFDRSLQTILLEACFIQVGAGRIRKKRESK